MAIPDYPANAPAQDSSADLVVQGFDIGTPELKELARLTGAREIIALNRAATQAFRLLLPIERSPIAQFCAIDSASATTTRSQSAPLTVSQSS